MPMPGTGGKRVYGFLKLLPSIVPAIAGMTPAWGDGGWVRQDIPLVSGWNLNWLAVEPADLHPANALASIDFEAVWTFVPGRLPGERGSWSVYYQDAPPFVNTLRTVRANRGYLIKKDANQNWQVTGRPINSDLILSGQTRDLFGTTVDPANVPSFSEYFSHPNVVGKVSSIYRMNPAGTFSSVSLGSTITPHAAFWVQASQQIVYPGPVAPQTPLAGLQFGINAYSHSLAIEVPQKNTVQTVKVRALPSAAPPPGESLNAAGNSASWLEYRDEAVDPAEWKAFLPAGVTLTVPANMTRVSLEVRGVRRGRAPATEEPSSQGRGVKGSSYQGLVEVTDGNGSRQVLAAGMEIEPVNGIWIGQANLTHVNPQSAVGDASVPQLAPPVPVSLILAIPGDEAPGDSARLLDQTSISVDRDGRELRLTHTTALFHEPVDLAGVVSNGTTETLMGTVEMPADHPLNPYRHRYNPEHREGYALRRDIEIQFAATDPDSFNQALGLDESVGDNELVGTYRETITGLSVEPIKVSGPFKLHRLSNTTFLRGTSN